MFAEAGADISSSKARRARRRCRRSAAPSTSRCWPTWWRAAARRSCPPPRLAEIGYAMAIYPAIGFLAAAAALEKAYAHLKATGDSTAIGESYGFKRDDRPDGLPRGLGFRRPLGPGEASDMTRFDSVKALVFDVFGTVVDWRERHRPRRRARSWRSSAGRTSTRARFADAWRRRYQPAMEECRSGRRPGPGSTCCTGRTWTGAAGPRHRPGRSARPALDDLNRAWHRLDPWPDAVAGLTRLKRRFIIAPLSNGNIALMVEHGEARRPALGRHPRRRGGAGLQAAAGSLPAHRRGARHPPGRALPGRGA